MSTKNYVVGKDVLSFCGRCKLTLSHTIMALKDANAIAKVECNTCHSVHAFKDPAKANTSAEPRKRKSSAASAVSINDIWLTSMNSTHTKSQPYSVKTKFTKGDVIDHPSFGPGVVDEIVDNTKMKVIFRQDIKILVHNL